MNEKELKAKLEAAFTRPEKQSDFLKTTAGNTYVVRLVPNMTDPTKTFTSLFTHNMTSPQGGFISLGCPSTNKEPCELCSMYFKAYKDGATELAKTLKRKERYFANVYVVDDPVNSANNGSVMILAYGNQLQKIIEDGWADSEVGAKMFDFSKDGCNLRIKVEKNQGGFPTYTASRFLNPSKVNTTIETVIAESSDLSNLVKIASPFQISQTIKVMAGEQL